MNDTDNESPAKAAPKPKPEKSAKRLSLEAMIQKLCAECAPGKSIDPTAIAHAFAAARGEDALAWRHWLAHVRTAAVGMARKGDLVIYRKGKPADPEDFRGVYRLGLPRSE